MSFLKSISSLNILTLHESPRVLDEKYKVYKGLHNIYIYNTYIYIHRDNIEREENKNEIKYIIIVLINV